MSITMITKRRLILTLDLETEGDEAIHTRISDALRDHATMIRFNNANQAHPETDEGLHAAGTIERNGVRLEWQLVMPDDPPLRDAPVAHVQV